MRDAVMHRFSIVYKKVLKMVECQNYDFQAVEKPVTMLCKSIVSFISPSAKLKVSVAKPTG